MRKSCAVCLRNCPPMRRRIFWRQSWNKNVFLRKKHGLNRAFCFCIQKTTRQARGCRKLTALQIKNSFAVLGKTVWQQSNDKQRSFYMTIHTMAHTTWSCKYHVVFAPKYRRKAFYGGRRLETGAILRELCR